MKIVLAGGGTGGPAIPLLAVAEKIKQQHPQAQFLFLGTAHGPERVFAEQYGIEFASIPSGKLRRYFSLQNILAPFLVLLGMIRAYSVLKDFRPNLIFSAGGYVSVPVVLAGKILGIKILIHQQDVLPTLSNKILAPFADKITVSFERSLKDFGTGSGLFDDQNTKAVWTGNPVRADLFDSLKKDPRQIKKDLGLTEDLPVILILGGATGALGLNLIIEKALPEITTFAQVVHSTGPGKGISYQSPNYHPSELIKNIGDVYAVADIVISRAGLSTITELAALKKVCIIVPLPDSHQFYNAEVLDRNDAAVVLDQKLLTPEILTQTLKRIMYNGDWAKSMQENISRIIPAGADQKIADLIIKLCHQKN